jgi:hypothetical protein
MSTAHTHSHESRRAMTCSPLRGPDPRSKGSISGPANPAVSIEDRNMIPFCGAVQPFERPNFNKILLGKGTKEKSTKVAILPGYKKPTAAGNPLVKSLLHGKGCTCSRANLRRMSTRWNLVQFLEIAQIPLRVRLARKFILRLD